LINIHKLISIHAGELTGLGIGMTFNNAVRGLNVFYAGTFSLTVCKLGTGP